jgi:hypothetical protein
MAGTGATQLHSETPGQFANRLNPNDLPVYGTAARALQTGWPCGGCPLNEKPRFGAVTNAKKGGSPLRPVFFLPVSRP